MILEQKTINATAQIGDNLKDTVKEAFEFSKLYNIEVKLLFNGRENTITKHTDVDSLTIEWFK